METRFIDGGEFVDKATYIETRGGLRKALERIAKLEADKCAWEACAQGHYEALSKANKRIAKLEAALPVAHRAALIAARQRRANSEGEK